VQDQDTNQERTRRGGRLRAFFLDLDARLDSGLFRGALVAREAFERYRDFMDRFHVGGWVRWICVEPLSEVTTFAMGGLLLALALAVPAFRQTSDEDWLKKSELAVVFLDRYGNEVGSRGIKHSNAVALADFPDQLVKTSSPDCL
jgi:penicillin-binding protein 1A